ncbi:MAG: hypothetical protein IID32_07335 [Planctomycetes bacterium]|nr:hypothetical protein [Planctomycetota bacterium]
MADKQDRIESATRDEVRNATPSRPTVIEEYRLRESGAWERVEQLRTLKQWEGSGNTEFSFNPDQTPWVLWWHSVQTSRLAATFVIFANNTALGTYDPVFGEPEPPRSGFFAIPPITFNRNFKIFPNEDRVGFNVQAAGVDWVVKIGVEP